MMKIEVFQNIFLDVEFFYEHKSWKGIKYSELLKGTKSSREGGITTTTRWKSCRKII